MTTVSEVQRALTTPIRDLPTDLARRYQAKLEGYRADFEPRGTLENDLVAEMAHLVLQLEQTRAVAAALVAIHVETVAFERQAVQQPPPGRGPSAPIATCGWPALDLQTLAFDATPDGERLRRHYAACDRALHRTIATFLKLRKAAAIAGSNTTLTEREYAGTAPVGPRPMPRARRAKSRGSPTHPSTSPATAIRPPRLFDNSIPPQAMPAPTAWSPPAP